MNTLQLREVLRCVLANTEVCTYKVCALDEFMLSPDVKYPAAFIVNSDVSEKPGTHWFAIYYRTSNIYYFMDSYGNPPDVFGLPNFKPVAWNQRTLQSKNVSVCGYFALMFIHLMSIGNSFESAVRKFSEKTCVNDEMVVRYVRRIYNRACKRNFY